MSALQLEGKKFGRLLVLGRASNRPGYRYSTWYVTCSCNPNSVSVVRGSNLISGHTTSCGCVQRERLEQIKHGDTTHDTKSVEYIAWDNMRRRCCKSNHPAYYNYGGRGITVCGRWLNSFENFLEDMGRRPPGMSLERINNDGNYEPENCKWATAQEQRLNQRKTVKRAIGVVPQLKVV